MKKFYNTKILVGPGAYLAGNGKILPRRMSEKKGLGLEV